MKQVPVNKTVNADDWRALVKAGDEIKSLQEMVDMFQTRAQAKINEANQKARIAWGRIKQANPDLDLDNVNYVPHDTDIGVLIPVSMRLSIK
jgi:hypothetical protein